MKLLLFFYLVGITGQQLSLKTAVQNRNVTLTCSFSSVTNPVLQWYGPGGVKYTEDTNIVKDQVKSFIAVSKDLITKDYTLRIIKMRSVYTGVYSCRVNTTVESQILLMFKDSSITRVYTRVQGNVTLKCPYPTPSSTKWIALPIQTTYALGVTINPTMPESIKNRISVDVATKNLNIHFVQLIDVAEYRCLDETNPNNFVITHLLPYLAPDYPSIENVKLVDGKNRTKDIKEDSQLILTCKSPNGVPPAVVTWRKHSEPGIIATGLSTVSYQMTASRNEDLKVYTCQSSSPAFVNNISTEVFLYFKLKPLAPSIIMPDTVKAGTEVNATCTSNGSRPPANTTWNFRNMWIDGSLFTSKKNPVTQTYTVESILRQQLKKSDNGKPLCCKASNEAMPGGRLSKVTMKVIFGPENVIITGNRQVLANGKNRLTLNCTTDEYNEFIYMTWYNGEVVLQNNAVVTNATGFHQGKVTSQILDLVPTYEQDGNKIKCEAKNEKYSDLETSNTVSLNLTYLPRTNLVIQVPKRNLTENVEINLTCSVTGGKPVPRLSWSCSGVSSTTESRSTTGDLHSVISTYKAVRNLNGIKCTCTGTQPDQWTNSSNTSAVHVLFGPDSVGFSGYDGNSNLTEKTVFSIRCTSGVSNPAASLRWYNGSQDMTVYSQATVLAGEYNGHITKQVWTTNLTRYDHGKMIICEANTSVAISRVNVTLKIKYGPYLYLYVDPNAMIIEGKDLTITCSVDSYPTSSVAWTKESRFPVVMSSDKIVIFKNISRKDNGTYTCFATAGEKTSSVSVDIIVLYPPDISFTYRNGTYTESLQNITCKASGNPDNYKFYSWKHLSRLRKEIRTLDGRATNMKSVVTLPDYGEDLNYQNSGYYVCTASNGIQNRNGVELISEEIFYDVTAPPVVADIGFTIQGELNKNVSIIIPFYSNPKYLNVSWFRGKDNISINIDGKKFISSITNTNVTLPFIDTSVTFNGQNATLIIYNIQPIDFTNYTLRVKNRIGEKRYTVSVEAAEVPESPTNLTIIKIEQTSVTLQWHGGFDGGFPQTFVIGLKKNPKGNYVVVKQIPDLPGALSYTLTNLVAGTSYSIRINAKNRIGDSDYAYLRDILTNVEDDPSTNGALIGGVSGGVAGILLAIVVIVGVVVLYKKRTTHKKDDGTELMDKRVKKAHDDDTDDGMKPNIIYESAGPDFKSPQNSQDKYLYAEVNKKVADTKKGDVYAEVNKVKASTSIETGVTVYAEVQKKGKHIKGKGTKDGKQKEKMKKAGKNMNKPVAGDVYENVSAVDGVPKLDGDVYANSDINHESSAKEKSSRRKNKDGLVYIDVVIKEAANGRKKDHIHGIENRNDYAEVDFTRHADPLPSDDEEPSETTAEVSKADND